MYTLCRPLSIKDLCKDLVLCLCKMVKKCPKLAILTTANMYADRAHNYSGYLNIQKNGDLTGNSNVDGNSRFGFDFCVLFGYSVSPKTGLSHCGSKLSTDMNVRFQRQRYAGTNT